MTKNISAKGIKLAILGAALAATAAVYASDSAPQSRIHDRAAQHQGHHGHHGFQHGHHGFHKFGHHGGKGMHRHHGAQFQRAGLIIPGYGIVSRDFVDGMGLNEQQLKLVEDARKAGRELRQERKERIKVARESRAELFKSDAFNPEQALKQGEERRAKLAAERRQIDEKWLAVWNALDSSQQARVTAHLKEKAERAEKRAEKREERVKQRESARSERQATRAS